MKRGTPEHYKTIRLANELGCSRPEASGLLEHLWHLTARTCPQGDIGKCTDAEIATGIYTTRDPSEVIRAFTASGWIDPDVTHRLLVHDWHEHADEAVRKLLKRRKLRFLTVSRHCRDMSRKRPDMSVENRAHIRGNGKARQGSEKHLLPEVLPDPDARDTFDAVWARYPNHRGKLKAVEAWRKATLRSEQVAAIHAALDWQLRDPEWLRDGGQYVPRFATYMHQRRWEDEPSAAPTVGDAVAQSAATLRKLAEGRL